MTPNMFETLEEAKAACLKLKASACHGVTYNNELSKPYIPMKLRTGSKELLSNQGKISCKAIP